MQPYATVTILGGGLAGGLIAFALAERRPELRLRLIEAGPVFGGNHIWSFFDSDIREEDRWIIAPFVSHRWPDYEVRFPAHRRVLGTGYNSIESENFDRTLRKRLPADAVQLNVVAHDLPDGPVIDARGPGDLSAFECGWQKFVGLLLETEAPHGVRRPIVMDATVAQVDGYRFVYVLPLGPTRLFVEDTYYSDSRALDAASLETRVLDYAAAQGWRAEAAGRRETGVLPVVSGGDFDRYWRSTGTTTAKAGMRAGLFHPTTGYSLPDAVRLASLIASAPDLSADGLSRLTHAFAARSWRERGFYRLLDRMLFRAAAPAERYRVLERFYRMPEALIARFYAARPTRFDQLRILTGKPPVPVGRAIAAIMNRRA